MPSASAREFQGVAQRLGFFKTRQTGSHERWIHRDGRAVTIPIHGGREIGPPLFHRILGATERECGRIPQAAMTSGDRPSLELQCRGPTRCDASLILYLGTFSGQQYME